jgi:hypothetical protein
MSNAHYQFTSGLMFPRAGDKPFVLSILRDINSYAPEFLPVRYGQFEPLRSIFDLKNPDEVIGEKDNYLLWTTKAGPFGQWTTGMHLPRKRHNELSFYGEATLIDVRPVRALLRALVFAHGVDYGWMHALCDEEFETYQSTRYEAVRPFNTGPSTYVLQKWLPNLAWGNVFGKPYIDLIGRKKLLRCPAYLVEEWTDDVVYIQLTDDINSIAENFAQFEESRQKAVMEIGTEFFYSPGAAEGSKIAPKFF